MNPPKYNWMENLNMIVNSTDCIICGRKNVGIPNQRIHEDWCWPCIKNRMEGKGYDSYGNPFKFKEKL